MNTKKFLPFHLFQYNGEGYIINVENMQVHTVDLITYPLLEGLNVYNQAELTPDVQAKLQQFGLIMSNAGKNKPSEPQKHSPITHMSLLVTRDCNLRCVYCYEDKTGSKMDEKTAFQAVDWLIRNSNSMRSIHIIFFGGEPLLNFPLVKSVVEYTEEEAHKTGKNAFFSITTNGTLLNDETNLFLKKHQVKIMISFDGVKELQDSQRPFASGCGSYDYVVPKIKNLLKIMPQTTGHAVIMGGTSPETVKDTLQEIGFHRVSVAMNSQSLFTDGTKEKVSSRDTHSMLSALENEAVIWYGLIKNKNLPSLKKLMGRSYLYGALLCLLNHTKKRYFCGAGQSMAAVTPTGEIYLCHRFVGLDSYKIGSIYNSELNIDKFSQSPVETNDICIGCFARFYCGGGCKHDHVSYCGSIDKPEEKLCQVKQRELELAATVVSKLSPEEKNWLVGEKIFPPAPCLLDF
jgi:uncharacterized protein